MGLVWIQFAIGLGFGFADKDYFSMIYEAGCYTGTGWRPPSGMRRVDLGQGTELREIFNWPNTETGQSQTNPAVILPVTVGRS